MKQGMKHKSTERLMAVEGVEWKSFNHLVAKVQALLLFLGSVTASQTVLPPSLRAHNLHQESPVSRQFCGCDKSISSGAQKEVLVLNRY